MACCGSASAAVSRASLAENRTFGDPGFSVACLSSSIRLRFCSAFVSVQLCGPFAVRRIGRRILAGSDNQCARGPNAEFPLCPTDGPVPGWAPLAMSRSLLILLSGLAVAGLGYFGVYSAGTAGHCQMEKSQAPELAWLKQEFQINDEEFA